MLPDELTKEQKEALLKGSFAMQVRVLCNKDQLDNLNAALDDAAKMYGVFLVEHATTNPTDSDVEEALEHEYEVDWGML